MPLRPLLPDALADALGQVVADCRREWQRDLALAVAQKDAMLADLRRENVELRHALVVAGDFQVARINSALAAVKDGAPGPEGRQGDPGEKGERGADGKDGEPGERGADGHDGAAGHDGPTGERGADGKDGAGIAAIERDGSRLLIETTDARTFDCGDIAGPPGEMGKDGPQGMPGRDGRDGLPGQTGERGLDGKDALNGKDGTDGRDGLGFDDMTVVYDGERSITLRFQRGEEMREFPLHLPVPVDRGVWRAGYYERGDVVTTDGSAFIAQRDTAEHPGTGKDWRLAVKRGRDGKDGKNGERGPEGKEGKAGRDLTQLGPDGSKW